MKAMSNSVLSFINARKNPVSYTEKRIKDILHYVIYCYQLQLSDKVKYSKSANTKQKFEDYLKTKFVDDYLRANKDYFQKNGSGIKTISFNKEVVEIYTDAAKIEQEDKIDISVKELGLQKAWSKDNTSEIYFAIECKRVKVLSDAGNYVSDIKKFAERRHLSYRLPFEGMIAFVENENLSHSQLSVEITKKLKATSSIITKQYLTPKIFFEGFNGTYASSHHKKSDNTIFYVYHLIFDYSKNISP